MHRHCDISMTMRVRAQRIINEALNEHGMHVRRPGLQMPVLPCCDGGVQVVMKLSRIWQRETMPARRGGRAASVTVSAKAYITQETSHIKHFNANGTRSLRQEMRRMLSRRVDLPSANGNLYVTANRADSTAYPPPMLPSVPDHFSPS